jgi:hypothetical protein
MKYTSSSVRHVLTCYVQPWWTVEIRVEAKQPYGCHHVVGVIHLLSKKYTS